jgi:hypothetical protein
LLLFKITLPPNFDSMSVSNNIYSCIGYTFLCIHTYHSRFIPEGVPEISQIFLRDSLQNDSAMRNTTDVTGGKPIAVWLQSISDVSAVNSLVVFYDIHGRKRKGATLFVLFCPGHHARYICVHKYVYCIRSGLFLSILQKNIYIKI